MNNPIDIAKYIITKYKKQFNKPLNELKLHKLLYLIYREYIIQYNSKLFEENFYGWKCGPILKSIREQYESLTDYNIKLNKNIKKLINDILNKYGKKSSWSLSRLTRGELSWKNSRIGIEEGKNGDNFIKYEDIVIDAKNIKERREKLSELKIKCESHRT